MKLIKLILSMFLTFLLTSCVGMMVGAAGAVGASMQQSQIDAEESPVLSVLQIRQMQEQDIEDPDVNKVLKVAINVLMDDGYTIDAAAPDVGLLRASKVIHERDVDSAGTAFVKGMFGNIGNSTKHTLKTIEAVVNVVSKGDDASKVRIASRLALTSNRGDLVYKPIYELEYYQEFFVKLRKGLFLEMENL